VIEPLENFDDPVQKKHFQIWGLMEGA